MVQMKALAPVLGKFESLGLAIGTDLKCHTRFDALQNADQSLIDRMFKQNAASHVFLARRTGRQILHRTAQPLCLTQGRLYQGPCHYLGVLNEILQQDPARVQVVAHSANRIKPASAQRSVKYDTIPAMQDPGYLCGVFCDKLFHGRHLLSIQCVGSNTLSKKMPALVTIRFRLRRAGRNPD